MVSKTDKVLRDLRPKYEPKQEIASEMFLPNHSGLSNNLETQKLRNIKLYASSDTDKPALKFHEVDGTQSTEITSHENLEGSGADHRHLTIYSIDPDGFQGMYNQQYGRTDNDIDIIKFGTVTIANLDNDDQPSRWNRNYTDNCVRMHFRNRVTDGGTYTLGGNVLSIKTDKTETSGTINSSVVGIDIDHQGDTGHGINISMTGTGDAINANADITTTGDLEATNLNLTTDLSARRASFTDSSSSAYLGGGTGTISSMTFVMDTDLFAGSANIYGLNMSSIAPTDSGTGNVVDVIGLNIADIDGSDASGDVYSIKTGTGEVLFGDVTNSPKFNITNTDGSLAQAVSWNQTISTTASQIDFLRWAGSIAKSSTGVLIARGLAFETSIDMTNVTSMAGATFVNAPTYTAPSTSILPSLQVYYDSGNLTSTGGASTSGLYRSFDSNPTFSSSSGGSYTITALSNYRAAGSSFSSGNTITTYNGYDFSPTFLFQTGTTWTGVNLNPTLAANTITTYRHIFCSDVTNATNVYGVYSAMNSAANKYFLYGAGTAASYLGGTLQVQGNVGFNGQTPSARQTYTVTNLTTDRSYDANATTIAELADVLGTLIADLRTIGLLA